MRWSRRSARNWGRLALVAVLSFVSMLIITAGPGMLFMGFYDSVVGTPIPDGVATFSWVALSGFCTGLVTAYAARLHRWWLLVPAATACVAGPLMALGALAGVALVDHLTREEGQQGDVGEPRLGVLAWVLGCLVAVPLGSAVIANMFGMMDEEEPGDPAEVLEWAQANDLLTAQDVAAVRGSGATAPDGWIGEGGCAGWDISDSLGVMYVFSDADWCVEECVFFEAGEEVYEAIERDIRRVGGSTERHELALVGADIVEAFAYEGSEEGGPAVVNTGDLVITIGTACEAITPEQIDELAQTAVDKLLD